MNFNSDFKYIFGEIVDLKIIDYYPGNDKELPFYWFDIIPKTVNKPVGKISIRIGSNYDSYYNGNIGYEVDEEYRGNNYSYYACKMVMEIAKYHNMKQINITCDFDNIASQKIIEKLGATLLEICVPPRDHIYYYEGMPAKRIYLLHLK